MDSTAYTVEVLGTGAHATQYLFLLLGFASSTVEPPYEQELGNEGGPFEPGWRWVWGGGW